MSGEPKNPILRKGYAYHEAGHCVAHFHFGNPILGVSIKDQGEGKGGVTISQRPNWFTLQEMGVVYEGTPERAEYYSKQIMISLAGEVAQAEYCLESLESHQSWRDRAAVKQYIKQVVPMPYPGEREQVIQDLCDKTRELLTLPKYAAAIQAVATFLQEHEELTGEKTTKLIREAITTKGSW